MTEALRLELGRMLDRYDEARRLAQDRQQQARADDALFLQRFADLRRGVVRPVFQAVGAILQERGHRYEVAQIDTELVEGELLKLVAGILKG